MQTLVSRVYAGTRDGEAVLALLRTSRATERAAPWLPLGELRTALAASPCGTEQVRVWEDAQGRMVAVGLLWDACVLVSALHPQAGEEELELDVLRWALAAAARAAHERGECGCLFVPVDSTDHRRIALLEREGFSADEWHTVHMLRRLRAPIAQPATPPGFLVRPAGAGEEAKLVALHNAVFVGLPKTSTDRHALQCAPTYRPGLDLVALAADGTLAGFCFGSTSLEETLFAHQALGWLERIGVQPVDRRRGLGRSLVLHMLHAMRGEGLGVALLTTGGANSAAQQLFAACGFHAYGETCWYLRSTPK